MADATRASRCQRTVHQSDPPLGKPYRFSDTFNSVAHLKMGASVVLCDQCASDLWGVLQ